MLADALSSRVVISSYRLSYYRVNLMVSLVKMTAVLLVIFSLIKVTKMVKGHRRVSSVLLNGQAKQEDSEATKILIFTDNRCVEWNESNFWEKVS